MATQPKIDLASLAVKAGIPSDEPAVRKFAELIALQCIDLCNRDRNEAEPFVAAATSRPGSSKQCVIGHRRGLRIQGLSH